MFSEFVPKVRDKVRTSFVCWGVLVPKVRDNVPGLLENLVCSTISQAVIDYIGFKKFVFDEILKKATNGHSSIANGADENSALQMALALKNMGMEVDDDL